MKVRTVELPGVHPSPNIQSDPALYEIENEAYDPAGLIEGAMAEIAAWDGKVVLDLGCGTGFHLPRFHEQAAHVIGVEPHGPSRVRAMGRVATAGLARVSVMIGSAEEVWLPDHSVDIVHSRFAYFFPPRCEPGLAELARVIRPGGTAFIIDNDLSSGTFADWLERSWHSPELQAEFVEGFWADHGFSLRRVTTEWRFQNRADLEAVVRLEFPPALAAQLIAEHSGLSVDYGICLYYRHY